MKLKIALVTALLLAPTLAAARGCSDGHQEQAMSYAEGSKYDDATQSCLPVTG